MFIDTNRRDVEQRTADPYDADPYNTDPRDEQSLPGALSSLEVRDPRRVPAPAAADDDRTRPLALRGAGPAPRRDVPTHVYDPVKQIAVDSDGEPVNPPLAKDWTTVEGTHTDGDGGDNELWSWEESS